MRSAPPSTSCIGTDVGRSCRCSCAESPPFRISWICTDTSLSFNALASGAADVSVVYHPYAATNALEQGIANSLTYAWRDSFMLVGPADNPAHLPPHPSSASIHQLFASLFRAAIDDPSVKFLSRYDKSAANIRESAIWTTLGLTPWSEPFSRWYHRYVAFPAEALRAASVLGEYTLCDRGSWYSAPEQVRRGMQVYKEVDRLEVGEDDALLNPALSLVSSRVAEGSRDVVSKWVKWMSSEDGGQMIVATFAVDGVVLHGRAPKGINPLFIIKQKERHAKL